MKFRIKRKTKTFNGGFLKERLGGNVLKGVAATNERAGRIGADGSISSGFIGQNL